MIELTEEKQRVLARADREDRPGLQESGESET